MGGSMSTCVNHSRMDDVFTLQPCYPSMSVEKFEVSADPEVPSAVVLAVNKLQILGDGEAESNSDTGGTDTSIQICGIRKLEKERLDIYCRLPDLAAKVAGRLKSQPGSATESRWLLLACDTQVDGVESEERIVFVHEQQQGTWIAEEVCQDCLVTLCKYPLSQFVEYSFDNGYNKLMIDMHGNIAGLQVNVGASL
eukprot:Filipodium_phascolosomae@DN1410_c0_g1_i3.p1